MNTHPTHIRRALISVSDKEGIIDFANVLHELGVEIISSGGTAKKLIAAGIPAIEISQFTGFPEMMDGRVKTLHPLVHGGILGLRDVHAEQAEQNNIKWIDLVVCNLYPFEKTIAQKNIADEVAIENIDIGGPSMIRSAAKNVGYVTVVVDPNDYIPLLHQLTDHGGVTYEKRTELSAKAFRHTASYDAIIADYFTQEKFPEDLSLTYHKSYDLRYGENPHQDASVYVKPNNTGANLLNAIIHQGKKLSYNNLNDANGALAALKEFTDPTCVVVKHANPCGVASNPDITQAFKRAYAADAMSAFGGIIVLNRPCTQTIAEEIVRVFAEIVVAPKYDDGALEILSKKKKMRVLEIAGLQEVRPTAMRETRFIDGGLLVQDIDTQRITKEDLTFPTERKPNESELRDLLFCWHALKHAKSNGILISRNLTTVGMGAGQVSRVDAVDVSIKKAAEGGSKEDWNAKQKGFVLASDAFFPFRDSIDKIAQTPIRAIIQPGGSIKDQEVIDACNEHGIAMVFTGTRCFKH